VNRPSIANSDKVSRRHSRQRQEKCPEEQRRREIKLKRNAVVEKRDVCTWCDISFRSVRVRCSFLDRRSSGPLCAVHLCCFRSVPFRFGIYLPCSRDKCTADACFSERERERERMDENPFCRDVAKLNEARLGTWKKAREKMKFRRTVTDWTCKSRGDDLSWHVYTFAHAALFTSGLARQISASPICYRDISREYRFCFTFADLSKTSRENEFAGLIFHC